MSTKKIEEKAVLAVQESISDCPYLEQYVAMGDKEPTWDGKIYIYDRADEMTRNYIGRVSVQVKGKLNEHIEQNEITYPVEVADIRRYAEDGGVVFFVVYITSNRGRKIYFSALTPIKLYDILHQCGKQKTKTLKFGTFPSDNDAKASLLASFYKDCKKQASYSADTMISIEELEKGEGITEITASLTGFGKYRDDPRELLLESEVYLYARKKGIKGDIPIMIVPHPLHIEETVKLEVTANGKKFFDRVKRKRTAQGIQFTIGEGIAFSMDESWKPGNITYKFSSSLYLRIREMDFFINAVQAGAFELGGIKIGIAPTPEQKQKCNIEELEESLIFYKKVQIVFASLNITKQLDVSKLTQDDWYKLNTLITAFFDKQEVAGLKKDLPLVVHVKVQDIYILLRAQQVEGKSGTYILENFFDDSCALVFPHGESEEQDEVPVYIGIKAEDYNMIDNIDFNNIVPSYVRMRPKTPNIAHYANRNVLLLLQAYDETPRDITLQVAEDLNNWILEREEDESKVAILNSLQIIRRRRELQEQEKQTLYTLVESPDSSEEEKTAAYSLLGENIAAEMHFKRMTPEEQERYKEFPIYRFMIRKET